MNSHELEIHKNKRTHLVHLPIPLLFCKELYRGNKKHGKKSPTRKSYVQNMPLIKDEPKNIGERQIQEELLRITSTKNTTLKWYQKIWIGISQVRKQEKIFFSLVMRQMSEQSLKTCQAISSPFPIVFLVQAKDHQRPLWSGHLCPHLLLLSTPWLILPHYSWTNQKCVPSGFLHLLLPLPEMSFPG